MIACGYTAVSGLEGYADRCLTFDLAAARVPGPLGDSVQADGRYRGFADVAIAATTRERELVVITLYRPRFDPLGVEVFNPFSAN